MQPFSLFIHSTSNSSVILSARGENLMSLQETEQMGHVGVDPLKHNIFNARYWKLKSLILYLMHSKQVVWPFSQTGIFLLLCILRHIGQRISSVNLFLMFSNSSILLLFLFSSNFSSRILICSFNFKFSFSTSLIRSMGTPAVLDPV